MCARNPMGKRDIVPDYFGRRKLACKKKKKKICVGGISKFSLIRIEIGRGGVEIMVYKFIKDLRKNLGIFWLIY